MLFSPEKLYTYNIKIMGNSFFISIYIYFIIAEKNNKVINKRFSRMRIPNIRIKFYGEKYNGFHKSKEKKTHGKIPTLKKTLSFF